ncbi:putative permease [Mycobacteroides abscessus]|nr:putative permease [Mycobacteroides abscessus]
MNTELTVFQKRVLAVLTGVGIAFGIYFLRGYLILIVVAGVAAYLFSPLYRRLGKRFGSGIAATLTLLCALGGWWFPSVRWFTLRLFRSPGWSTVSPAGWRAPI